jgi:hypothetical protein
MTSYNTSTATSDEIMPLVQGIGQVIHGHPIANATMALLYTIFVMSYPGIKNEDLVNGIRDASGHICMMLDTFENGLEVDKSKIN